MTRQPRRRLALVALGLALLLAALPAAAYTVYLKDGTRIIARDRYTVRGEMALLVLQNGTQTSIALSEIDVPRTEKANRSNLGTAVVIEGGETRDTPTPVEPEERPSLGELSRNRRTQPPAARPPAQRPATPSQRPGEEGPAGTAEVRFGSTPAGYPDLLTAPRRPYGDVDLVGDLKRFYNDQGFDVVQVYEGSTGGSPLVDITTTSEASVFRAVAVTASAVVSFGEQGRGLDAVQLFLATANRERAGQFLVTPELARSLLSKEIDISTFYVENVQF